ncbi:MAG: response regulator transcription factor, partial [Mesorhizobium sp.]
MSLGKEHPFPVEAELSWHGRVVVAERNPFVVSALREMLECDGRFDLLGVVHSGAQFLDMATATQFDVAVVGWKLADMDGADVLTEVQSR